MPTYDYSCKKCGNMEIKQSITEDALTKCPKCGGTEFKKLVSKGAGVIFKGSGFYETDYKKKENPEPSPCTSCDKSKDGSCGA